ncbi:MAG TPA: PrgI family protein, partial [Candidatus Saccharimonadales bacterium]|nr:PrgI family protein [Candidatus Saccharimonadales bacterium]
MATYKVIQDVEAEDKLVGPLTLRQFIYAGIAGLSLYLGFLAVSKHAGFMLAIFVPIAGVSGFFAFPWNRDQPTEIWALAKLRFLIKPRKRVWDQSGAKDLVTVTAPKVVEHHLTNGLSENEVRSRLSALANTIDSRGWAVKNVNVNLSGGNYGPGAIQSSDRLVSPESMPQEVNPIE